MKPFKEHIVDFSVTHYNVVMVCTLLLTLVTGAFFPLVKMDTDPENMLEINEPARVFHNAAKKRFDLSDTVVLGVINEKDPDGVFNPETLTRIYEVTEFAKTLRWPDENNSGKMSGVIEADMIAPSLVDHMSRQGPGTIRFDWLMEKPPKTRAKAIEIRQKALSNPLLKGQMISEDGRAICIYLPLTDKLLSYRVYKALQEKIGTFTGDDQFQITGLPVAEGAIGVEMFTQMSTASPLAMAVILALLFLFFRKWRIVILPMIIATVSIVAAMGLMIAVGFPVHILSSMLPIFLMSIAMVDSVHVLSEFFDVYTPEKGRKQTVRQVMSTLFAPMLYTSLTTAAGFLSLTLAPIPPARVFGLFLGIGVMIAWIVTIFFVPAYIMMTPEKALADFGLSAKGRGKSWLVRPLAALGRFTHRRAKSILVLLVAVILVSVWGISQIRINDNYAKRFDLSHPIRQADIALNNHFGGTYMAYLVLESPGQPSPDGSEIQNLTRGLAEFALTIENEFPQAPGLAETVSRTLPVIAAGSSDFEDFVDNVTRHLENMAAGASEDTGFTLGELQVFFGLEKERNKPFKRPDVLSYMADLQAHLLETGLIGKATSVADVVRKVNQELTDGRPESFVIPRRFQSISECYLQYQQSHRPNDLWHMVTPDYSQANIRLQFPTGDSINTKATVAEVRSYVEANPLPASLTYRWAGLHYINLVLEGKLVRGFLESFAGSFLIVFIMMAYLFRSLLWGGLCMVPLTITLGAIYGITGIAGKDYDLPIAVLSALSIGMAVDFAIHFLERARAGYRERGSWDQVVGHMFGEPARAITRNVLVIAIGFLPLLVASLVPYKTTGVMLFMILSCSGLITLLALPAILTIGENFFFKGLYPDKKRGVTTMKVTLTAIICILLPAILYAGEGSMTATEIVIRANHMALYQGQDTKGSVRMEIEDNQGRIRCRAFNILRKNADTKDRDQLYFTYFQAPADVRKMVFMVHKHAALDVDDDRWLYMPSLDLVKRIAAGDKRTSFVGSDFLYEDISGRSPEEDRHELAGTTDRFYEIKSIPKNPGSVEFEYSISYVDKQTFMPMKMAYYKRGNLCARVIEVMKLENIEALEDNRKVVYPTAVLTVARNLETGSRTTMAFSGIRYNTGFGADLFTERYLRRPSRDVVR